MTEEESETGPYRRAGQLLFALGFLAISSVLLALIGEQTEWKSKTKLFAQPSFWPAVALGGMVLFSALHIRTLKRRRFFADDWIEARIWLRPLEFALWFMAYVFIVPVIGFLPASMIFAPLLAWREGYRTQKMLWLAAAFGAVVVVIFKALLQVRIPAGTVYEYLPNALRSFAILYL